jgi:hypothetical protein
MRIDRSRADVLVVIAYPRGSLRPPGAPSIDELAGSGSVRRARSPETVTVPIGLDGGPS